MKREYGKNVQDNIFLVLRILLLALFVVISSRSLFDLKLMSHANSGGALFSPEYTTDSIIRDAIAQPGAEKLSAAEGVFRPTETLRAAVNKFPEKSALLFVGPPDNPAYLQMRLIVSYLSWPRPVYAPACGWVYAWDSPPAGTSISGVIYYLSIPPAGSPAKLNFLPQMTLVSATGTQKWDSYCSQ